MARESGNDASTLEPMLLEAEALGREGDLATAQAKLLTMWHGQASSTLRPFECWQIESALARLSEAERDPDSAAGWFQRAIATFRLQRDSLSHIDSKLPFVESDTGLYLDYMEELLREGKPADALRVLGRSRAEMLTDVPANQPALSASARDTWAGIHVSSRGVARHDSGILPASANLLSVAIAPNTSMLIRLPGRKSSCRRCKVIAARCGRQSCS